jgi:hypothetical protein
VINLEHERQASQSSLADGVAGLRLTHGGGPTDIVAELINVSETGSLAFYDRMKNLFFHKASEQVAISFNLEEGHQSFLILKNTTDRPQRPRILLDYSGRKSPYDILVRTIPPQQVEIIDIRHLRDARVPDQNGQTLPPEVSFGGARILSEPGAFVGSDPTFIARVHDLSVYGIAISCMGVRLDTPPPPPPPPPQLPEIAFFEGVRISPDPGDPRPTPGEPFQVRWGVWNPGQITADAHTVRIRAYKVDLVPEQLVFQHELSAPPVLTDMVAPPQEWNWPVTVADPGQYCVYVDLDVYDEVEELSELNNTTFQCVQIPS